MAQFWTMFKAFFINYFWLGLLLVLLSLLINQNIKPTMVYLVLTVKTFETVGISLLIASLFSYTFESISFQDKMQNIVEKIVIKKSFLSNLSNDKKKEALRNLLKPSEEEMEKYSNIEDYYNYYIDETLNVSKKNVRSNYSINLKAKFDSVNKKVYTDGIYSYRLYPSENGFTNISVGFLKEDTVSKVDIIINLPDGQRKKIIDSELEYKTNDLARYAEVKVDQEFQEYKHLDVELRVIEYGFNHWMNVFFKAEQATDGFKFTLYCDDDISIKTHNVFDVGHNYHVDLNGEKNEVHISCHQWINEGSGILVIVSKPDEQQVAV
ncbi:MULTISPECIES: hypothetical protein [unclassified Sulfuricurvum]|uniref:hypothetical protein n=1 Tax=unclassified Sulfuricurvum TaxID=2632390 RepID=UPI000299828C|nr:MULTISPECIES: hypothetical protein [unclassified Sulfuricurvum]AFV98181.1 hypothetical protein B649_09345 [Candidatus Sulfuricurvum sp. RIFRC-1]HBM34713.1 hypothetical protein [Sulfuricurvum sp.]